MSFYFYFIYDYYISFSIYGRLHCLDNTDLSFFVKSWKDDELIILSIFLNELCKVCQSNSLIDCPIESINSFISLMRKEKDIEIESNLCRDSKLGILDKHNDCEVVMSAECEELVYIIWFPIEIDIIQYYHNSVYDFLFY